MTVLYILICVVLLLMLYCYSETLRIKNVTYRINDIKLPVDLSGKRILLLSDIHCISFGKSNKRLFDRISKLKPDYVIIAGDLVNGHKESEFKYAEDFFIGLKASVECPIYYTYGNHELKFDKYLKKQSDIKSGTDRYTDIISKYCILLNNDSIKLCNGCRLYGLVVDSEYYHGSIEEMSGNFTIKSKLGKPDRTKFYNILIAHDPSFYKKYLKWGADVTLSGHLHGGIFRLPYIGGIISPRYRFFPKPDKGCFNYQDGKIIVSGGLGWHGIPFRFCNPPEIIEIIFSNTGDINEPTGKA